MRMFVLLHLRARESAPLTRPFPVTPLSNLAQVADRTAWELPCD